MSLRECDVPTGRGTVELWREVESLAPDAELSPPIRRGVLWEATPTHFRLRLRGVACCRVDDGGEVLVERDVNARKEDLRWFVQGLPLAALWVQRHRLVMCGAAVSSGNGAALILGHSGAGKSTLAAGLALRGLPVVCDAVVPLAVEAARLEVLPALPDVQLDAASIETLGGGTLDIAPVRAGLPRWFVCGLAHTERRTPVRIIYVLRAQNRARLEFAELRGQEKLLRLLAYAFNRRLPELARVHAANFPAYAASFAGVRVIEVTRPEGMPTIFELIERVLADLA